MVIWIILSYKQMQLLKKVNYQGYLGYDRLPIKSMSNFHAVMPLADDHLGNRSLSSKPVAQILR